MAAHTHLPPPPRRVAGPAPQSGGDRAEQGSRPHRGPPHRGRNRALEAIGTGTHVVGAHTLGQNDHTIGIENEGTYMTEEPTGALWEKLVATCAWPCDVYGLEPHAAIVGHRDYNATAFPGDPTR